MQYVKISRSRFSCGRITPYFTSKILTEYLSLLNSILYILPKPIYSTKVKLKLQ